MEVQADKPWWRQASVVTMLTALIAAIVPSTTAVQAHFESKRALAIQESKQEHEIRTSYLDRLDKPGTRMRTLRFVLATTDDDKLRTWATDEMVYVQGELGQIDQRIAELQQEKREIDSAQSAGSLAGSPPSHKQRRQEIENELRALESDKHGSAAPSTTTPAPPAPPFVR